MRIKHTRGNSITVAALALGLLAVAASAQSGSSSYPPATSSTAPSSMASSTDSSATALTVNGKIISSSPTSLVVQTDAGTRLTLVVDSVSTQPPALAMGDHVTLRYTAVGGAYHADSVALLPNPVASNTMTSNTMTTPPVADTTYNNDANSASSTSTATTRRGKLPKTASHMPLVLVMGAITAALGYGLHLTRSQA